MAKKTTKTRILDGMTITVVKKENPFTAAVQAKLAAAVLGSNGKTVEAAKAKGANSWVVRQLVDRKIVRVEPSRGE